MVVPCRDYRYKWRNLRSAVCCDQLRSVAAQALHVLGIIAMFALSLLRKTFEHSAVRRTVCPRAYPVIHVQIENRSRALSLSAGAHVLKLA